MGTPENLKLSEIVDRLRSWIPRKMEPANVSRDFWMPDQSCRVCYECDSQFTVFNRRHHCRLCGRVFCAKCTANSIPAPSDEPSNTREDWERIRVCNYCFKQWEQEMTRVNTGMSASSPGISPSPSVASLVSTQSSSNSGSSVGSTTYSTGPYQHVPSSSGHSLCPSAQMDPAIGKKDQLASPPESGPIYIRDPFPEHHGSSNRSDDEDDDYDVYRSNSEPGHFSPADTYYNAADKINQVYGPYNPASNFTDVALSPKDIDMQSPEEANNLLQESDRHNNGVESEASPSSDIDATDHEPVDFENNDLLWLPPDPEDQEDEREALLPEDDDEGADDTTGEWGYLRSSSSSIGVEFRNRDRSMEEHRKAMKNVLGGHFRALIAQLLQIENLPVSEGDNKESWLEIITSLSWEAATLLKPDTSKSGGMDPGGYVKIKCLGCGLHSESMVVKGVVCKKNVAHRRMTSKIDKPRLLILGGALEYQRVANHLSSFDTLLQQEMDHLKMAVAKIDAHHPNILLVEKSVSRFAQEYLLAKNISLVLNVKRPLLERIARCTGAQIVPSIDQLTAPKLGYCDAFHVEKFLEEHGSAGQGGKKLIKTLMFFEGCPKPFGCTILLKGASGDELKKVKHVLQYGVFAAYHLALETSFLADEGASLPELPLKSPIKVVLPDKPPSIDRSISTIPGFSVPAAEKLQGLQIFNEQSESNCSLLLDMASPSTRGPVSEAGSNGSVSRMNERTDPTLVEVSNMVSSFYPSRHDSSALHQGELYGDYACAEKIRMTPSESAPQIGEAVGDNNLIIKCLSDLVALEQCISNSNPSGKSLPPNSSTSELTVLGQENNNNHEVGSKEEFPPSPSDHQSILVSLTTRCVWKGTVCERAHLFRIKYYGSFDKPLGRFLRDHLFDQSFHCRSCDMPSEAHIHCYTHQQGSLTISVKKLPEILLPGEREGKIWMWHRCLRCPRTSGFPPSTRRVVMSDAAWGLSFGKFLELSFSNHAAASRVASCGHSLHRDCLRFYGFGRMVACFRYAPIIVNSVYLPPSKLEFNYDSQDWIQKEVDEIRTRADHLFDEVFKALRLVLKRFSVDNGANADELGQLNSGLEVMLEKEKFFFEESLQQVLHREVKVGQPAADILEINRLKRQLVYLSYIWDKRLMHVNCLCSNNIRGVSSLSPKLVVEPVCSSEKYSETNATARPGRGFSSCDSFLLNEKPDITYIHGVPAQVNSLDGSRKGTNTDHNLIGEKDAHDFSSSRASVDEHCSPESGTSVRRILSEGQFPVVDNLSDTLDAAWTGESQSASKDNGFGCPDTLLKDTSNVNGASANVGDGHCSGERDEAEVPYAPILILPTKVLDNMENTMAWVWMPFPSLYPSLNKNSSNHVLKFCKLSEYNPVYVSSFRELVHQGGGRLLLPVGVNDIVVPVYDDEPTSIISYALASPSYRFIMSDEHEKSKDALESSSSLPILDSFNLLSLPSLDETASESLRSLGSVDESMLLTPSSRGSFGLDPLLYANALHARVSFQDDGPLGKVKYTVTCYYAKRFEALRRICCPSELDYVRSLSRCKKWGAQGGKSNVFFAKTLDDRFIIKQVTKTELESFIKFAPAYFKYLSDSICTGSPTCLAKILGIYQVTSKHLKGGKETKMDVLVMENLLYRRNITRLYDLKGSSRSRYNPDSSGSNKVLLDQNLIETMPTSPIFVGTKAKRLLERAVWNDTSFLSSVDVMDYSLLVGVDEEKHELVLGIIDFMRQYTWDKHLESWVKATGILGGPKNASPTVISPNQYKKRFRKAMSAYFLMVPDQWPPSEIIPSRSQSDQCEENSQGRASL